MGASRERPATSESKERSSRHAPAERTPAITNTLPKQGDALEGIGNRALIALMRAGRLQAKSRSSQPDAERESPSIDENKKQETDALSEIGELHGGQPLDAATRALMESRFGEPFDDVRIHIGPHAEHAASALAAHAFTVGEDIVFGENQFAPETTQGRRILAHELAHVVQQRRAHGPIASETEAERDADRAAETMERGHSVSVQERAPVGAVQRQPQGVLWTPVIAEAVPLEELGRSWVIQAEGMPIITIEGFRIPKPSVEAEEANRTLRMHVWVAVDDIHVTSDGKGRWDKTEVTVTGPLRRLPQPVPPKPKPKPPAPKPPGKKPPSVEPPGEPPRIKPDEEPKIQQNLTPSERSPTTPNARVTEALDKDPAKAVAIASQLSALDLAELEPDTRIGLLRALADYPEITSADTLLRTLAATPIEDAGFVLDALREDPKLLLRLRATLPPTESLAFEVAMMDLSARRHRNPSLPLEAIFPSDPAPFDLASALKGAPRDPREVVWLGNPLLRPDWTRGLKMWTDDRGNTNVWSPEMGVTSWDWEGKRLGPSLHPDYDEISRGLRVTTELARTGGRRYVPGKAWVDEAGWQENLAVEKQLAKADATRRLADLASGVKSWKETQTGVAYLASGPAHLLGGVSFSEPENIVKRAEQDVGIAYRELEQARTPFECAQAKRHLASATRRAERLFGEHKEKVNVGGERTIVVIKAGAVATTAVLAAPVLLTYATAAVAGGTVVSIGGELVVLGGSTVGWGGSAFALTATGLGTGLFTGTMGGALESAHKGLSWENYGKGFADNYSVGLTYGLGIGAARVIPPGFWSGALTDATAAGLGGMSDRALHGGSAGDVFEAGGTGFLIGGGMGMLGRGLAPESLPLRVGVAAGGAASLDFLSGADTDKMLRDALISGVLAGGSAHAAKSRGLDHRLKGFEFGSNRGVLVGVHPDGRVAYVRPSGGGAYRFRPNGTFEIAGETWGSGGVPKSMLYTPSSPLVLAGPQVMGLLGPGPQVMGLLGPGPQVRGLLGPGPQVRGLLGPGPQVRGFLSWQGARELPPIARALIRPSGEIESMLNEDPAARNVERNQVLAQLRDVHEGSPPKYPGYIHEMVLAANVRAIEQVRGLIRVGGADRIVGIERGGAFLSEVVAHGDPALASKLRILPKTEPVGKFKFDALALQGALEQDIAAGARKIMVVDAYMGGKTAEHLRDGVFKPLSQKYPDVIFEMVWLRETFGFETKLAAGQGIITKPPKGGISPNSPFVDKIKTTLVPVPLVLGDDMNIVLDRTPGSREPIRIFNNRGQIVQVFEPGPNETTRELLIRLMSGEQ